MSSMWLNLSTLFCMLSTSCLSQREQHHEISCLDEFSNSVAEKSAFSLKATIISEEDIGDTYLVSILSPQGKYFEGFLLEAHDPTNVSAPLGGFFSSQPNTRRKSCGPFQNNSLTHEGGKKMQKLVVIWTPPVGYQGKVVFRAYITEKRDGHGAILEAVPGLIRRKNEILPENRTSVPPITLPESMEEAARECGSRKSCFGLPEDCMDREGSCEVLVSFVPQRDGVNFQLTGRTSKEVSWIAVGLSRDSEMGDDSVTDCIFLDSGKIVIQQSWNYDSPKSNEVLPNPHEGIFNMKGRTCNGTITCTWTRRHDTRIHGTDFNLVRKKWHLLLAKGPVKHGEKTKHHGAIASEKSFNLTSHTSESKYPAENSGQESCSELHEALSAKQRIIATYKKYITVLRNQIDRARKEMSSAVQMLDEASRVPEKAFEKRQKRR